MSVMVALALLAAKDTTSGFGPADAARYTRDSARTAASDGDMAAAAARLRVAMVVNPQAAADALPTNDCTAIEAGIGRVDAASAAGIAWFFRTAIERSDMVGLRGRTYWYNPLVDLALIVNWRRIDGSWHPVTAQVIAGTSVRAAALAGPWMTAEGVSYQKAFADRALATLSALSSAREVPDGPTVFARGVSDAERGLAALRGDTSANAGSLRALNALATAQTNSLPEINGGPNALALAALPLNIRRSMTVLTGYRRDAGWLAAIASPLRPDLVFFADLDPAGVVTRISPVNLANRVEAPK